jgi:O-antigen ligase
MVLSWLNWINPTLAIIPVREVGVPVKNRITQGQEFLLCAFGAMAIAITFWRSEKLIQAILLWLLSVAFLLNMVFVVSSRTALISVPVLLLIFAARSLTMQRWLIALSMIVVLTGAAWYGSPNLRTRIASIGEQYKQYADSDAPTSAGLRLEYWHKSIAYIKEAPLIGNGTGSVKRLFEKAAAGKTLVFAAVTANPHNQILYFGVQWGIVGILLLLSMWATHFLAFIEYRFISSIGMLVVLQNIIASFLNSHISDFVEGWLYVMGVGIAAGAVLKERQNCSYGPAANR